MSKTMNQTKETLTITKYWQSLTVMLSAISMKFALLCFFALFVSVSSVYACAMNSVECKSGINLSKDEDDFGR